MLHSQKYEQSGLRLTGSKPEHFYVEQLSVAEDY